MNALLSRWRNIWTGGSRSLILLLAVALLIGGARLAEWFVVQHDQSHFEEVVDRQCADYLSSAVQAFAGIQRSTRRVATEIAGQSAVIDFLSQRDTSYARIFNAVVSMARNEEVGIEVYDTLGSLICWEGPSGPRHPQEVHAALAGQMASYVNMTPIASQLFVTIPVRSGHSILGAILVRRTIDVNYPLNNRYIKREGLTSELTHRLGVTIDFDFAFGAQPRKDGRYASAVLYGIDSSRVGVVSLLRPPRAAYLETAALPFENAATVLTVLLLIILALIIWRWLDRPTVPSLLRVSGVVVVIWAIRFALLGLDIGNIVTIDSLFNPALFASQFGGGIAQSLGDMTLSIGALALTVWYLLSRSGFPRSAPAPGEKSTGRIFLGVGADIVIALLVLWLLRAFGALAQGVVFDSTIHLNDPRVIVPGFELSVMMADVLVAAVCLLAVGIAAVRLMLKLVSRTSRPSGAAWVFVAVLLALLSWIFGEIQNNPLMDTVYRLLFSALALGGAGVVLRVQDRGKSILTLRNLSLLLIAAILLYYPLIDRNIRDKDRDRVESFANEAVRPIDNWMSLIVDDGLNGLTDNSTVESFVDGDTQTVSRLAFTRWAQSLACREGYSSLFELTDAGGTPISRFAIGSQIQIALETDSDSIPPPERIVAMRGIGTGITALHVYYGSAPIRGFDGNVLGYARVLVAAGPQTLFRGENPGVLRPTGPEGLRSFYRPVTVSEYRDGAVVTTNNPIIPIRRAIPPAVVTALQSAPAVWIEETIGGQELESYYIRRPDGNGNVVALSIQEPGLEWHLVGLVRLVAFCAVLILAAFSLALIVRRARGETLSFTFRDRLLAALLVTALIPLALSTVYSRYYARERHMAATSTRLSDYTLAIAQNLPVSTDSLDRMTPDGAACDRGGNGGGCGDRLQHLQGKPACYVQPAGTLRRRHSGSPHQWRSIPGCVPDRRSLLR